MKIVDNDIILNEEEDKAFTKCFKRGVYKQLYKEKLLTSEQLNELLQSLEK